MPIFEYRCTSCDERYEALVSRAERSTPPCPRCGAMRAKRLISTFAVVGPHAEASDKGPCGSADCACHGD